MTSSKPPNSSQMELELEWNYRRGYIRYSIAVSLADNDILFYTIDTLFRDINILI